MNKLLKIKTVSFYFFLTIIIVIAFFRINKIAKFNLPVSLGYVYSGSMEPTIKTYDGYILIRSKKYKVNDIITFKASYLKEPYVTHRIVELSEDNKFITKGDNNQSKDQEGGEPLINKDQILGKVFTIKGKPFIIPHLGVIFIKVDSIIKKLNLITLISIIIVIYSIDYIFYSFFKQHKKTKHKHQRLLEIAPYFDLVFLALSVIIFINTIFIGLTLKSWNAEEISYVVVSTKGISSPLPNEEFTKTMSLKNITFIPLVSILESKNRNLEVYPNKLHLTHKQHVDYTLTIKAPEEIGYYTNQVEKKTYPDVLPDKWLDFLYSKNEVLPLIVIFSPGIIITILLFAWWNHRWKIGRRKVMEWLIPFRVFLNLKNQ